MSVLKINLDKDGESAVGSEGLSLADLLGVLVLGEKRETDEGYEIRFNLGRVAARIGARAAAQMQRLDGTVILVTGDRIRECRRTDCGTISGEEPRNGLDE